MTLSENPDRTSKEARLARAREQVARLIRLLRTFGWLLDQDGPSPDLEAAIRDAVETSEKLGGFVFLLGGDPEDADLCELTFVTARVEHSLTEALSRRAPKRLFASSPAS